jgi:adenosylmethionine-8-amino-7-oxononanoate aminotransferase
MKREKIIMNTLARGWAEEDKLHMLHGGVALDDFAENGTRIILDSAYGIRVRDIHDKEYIDAVGGAVCNSCGHVSQTGG